MKKLIIYDVDDTLFFANQRIGLNIDGEFKWITPQEFHDYDMAGLVDHSVDYSLLLSSDDFVRCLKPNHICIQQLIADIEAAEAHIVILTARGEMDDVEKFKSAFRDHGIDIDTVELLFCNQDDPTMPSFKKKAPFFRGWFMQGWNDITVYDDNWHNLEMIDEIAEGYPDTTVKRYHIAQDGSFNLVEPVKDAVNC